MVGYRIVERRSPPDGAEDARPGMTDLGGILDITEDPLDEPDLDWFHEPRDKKPASEYQRQRTFLASIARLAPGAIVWAVPNGSKDTDWQRMRKTKEGARAGVPDLTIVWSGGCAFIEMKGGQTPVSKPQRAMLNRLYRAGQHCGVFRDPFLALDYLRSVGCPIRETVS